MQFRDLEAVEAVFRYKSFSEAAYRMNFSLSAISKQVTRAEKELGHSLFNKRVKGQTLTLTHEGEVLMPAIQDVIERYSNLVFLANNMNENDSSSLAIGYTPLIGTIGEGEIISNFSADNPDVAVSLMRSNNTDLVSMLMSGSLDAVFILMTNATPANFKMWEAITRDDLRVIPTMRNRTMFLGVSCDHPLAGRDKVTLDEVRDELFIFTLLNDPSDYSNRIGEFQRLMSNKEPRITPMFMDFSNRDVVLRIVESGKAVLPQVVKPLTGGKKIKYIEVEGWPDEAVGLFISRKTNNSKALRTLTRYVREYSKKEGVQTI